MVRELLLAGVPVQAADVDGARVGLELRRGGGGDGEGSHGIDSVGFGRRGGRGGRRCGRHGGGGGFRRCRGG